MKVYREHSKRSNVTNSTLIKLKKMYHILRKGKFL